MKASFPFRTLGPRIPGRRLLSAIAVALALGPASGAAQAGAKPASGSFRLAVDPANPPYQFLTEDGLRGFNVDVIERVGVHHGIRFELLPMSLREGREALAKGRVDAILGYPYSMGASQDADFSEPLVSSSVGILVRKDGTAFQRGLTNLTDWVLALERDSPAYTFLKNIRSARFNETASASEALELLALDRADALLADRMTILHLLRTRGWEDRFRFAASYWMPVEYTVAASREDAYLLYLVDTGIRELKDSGVYSALFERWFREGEYETQRRLRRLLGGFVALVLASALLAAFGVWWNRQLAARVRARTADLDRMNRELIRQIGETEDKKEFIHQILESSPRGLVTCDREGRITVCNSRAREIGGLVEDPVGKPYTEYPLFKRFLEGKAEVVLSGGGQYLFQTEEWERPDGAVLHIRYGLYPLRDHEGRVEGVIFSFEDHTREKALQDRVFEREKNRALSRLVAGVAHEIRNPLTSIKTFVELLPRKSDNPKFLAELADHVPREVERMDGLIRNLIDFARPRAAAGALEDLGALVQSCAVLLAPLAAKRGIRLRTEAPGSAYAFVDRDQVRQCILNGALNSMDALEELGTESAEGFGERGEIVLAVRKEGSSVRVEVRDRGIGMTEEEVLRALEPFYTTKPKGVGLGLPLTRQYVEENRGVLRIESVKGEGTTMSMEFPAAEE